MNDQYPFLQAEQLLIKIVWLKGTIIPRENPDIFREDICGSIIKYSDHGNTNSIYGWEIDHIKPVSKGGDDSLSNLQPLKWINNRRKGDTYPWSG